MEQVRENTGTRSAELRFVTQHFPLLQGLRFVGSWVHFAVLCLIVWHRDRLGSLMLLVAPLGLLLPAFSVHVVGRWYERRFGVLVRPRGSRLQSTIAKTGLFLLGLEFFMLLVCTSGGTVLPFITGGGMLIAISMLSWAQASVRVPAAPLLQLRRGLYGTLAVGSAGAMPEAAFAPGRDAGPYVCFAAAMCAMALFDHWLLEHFLRLPASGQEIADAY